MGEFFHALRVFGDELASVGWLALAIALGLHFLKVVFRTFAWRNILQAAYPEERVPWPPVFGAYVAGVGVNSIVPGRGGDLVKLYLVHRRVPNTTYTTLASTLFTETLLDIVLATAIFLWALTQGVLPSLHVLPNLPSFDWGWLFRHSKLTATAVALLTVGALWLTWRTAHKVEDFKQRVGRGVAILRDRRRYLREVVSWQVLSWVCRIAALYWFLRAFHVHPSVHNALLAQVVDSLATLLPFSPGGAGTKQGLLVYVLKGQASASRLLAFSVGMYAAVTIFNVVAGAIALLVMLRTLRLGQILGRAKAAQERTG
ncbi:MAG TPA: lysylphosphatidylglycerol synthase transmembrane domain-containing protein [Gaiellaceae bacterium]|nr:lysylphosphatidylglycerol synthase transmembrane domain-containing protein [Gaiellaceae bacterium]